jgi:hypothetical protein
MGILSRKIDEFTTVTAAITESLKNIPTKQDLHRHKASMEETLNTIAEVNMGLTTAMDQYKFSDSTPLGGRQSVAGPSGTQPFMNPGRAAAFLTTSVSSVMDTGSEYSWDPRLRGGAGSNTTENGAADGAAGRAADGAAGGVDRGGPLPPPDPPPSDRGGPGC